MAAVDMVGFQRLCRHALVWEYMSSQNKLLAIRNALDLGRVDVYSRRARGWPIGRTLKKAHEQRKRREEDKTWFK